MKFQAPSAARATERPTDFYEVEWFAYDVDGYLICHQDRRESGAAALSHYRALISGMDPAGPDPADVHAWEMKWDDREHRYRRKSMFSDETVPMPDYVREARSQLVNKQKKRRP